MKQYRIETEELHVFTKEVTIHAPNKKEAIRRAKANDWDDSSGEQPTGDIYRIKVIKIEDEGKPSW